MSLLFTSELRDNSFTTNVEGTEACKKKFTDVSNVRIHSADSSALVDGKGQPAKR